ncbi:hypothetical protein FQA39_LY04578 [Lamprigera yunnana]|nr:hypothetical protein FQA39_LY04578 [Lamprigera yunnana]
MTVSCLQCVFGSYVLKQRYVLCFMAFLGMVNDFCLRNCLNIAITEMVKPQLSVDGTVTECPSKSETVYIQVTIFFRLDWTSQEVAWVLASFFPGYVATHIPGGFLADAYGGKHVLGLGVLTSAIISLVTPIAIDIGGVGLLCALRFLIGVVQGPLFPSVTTLLARWVPKKERSRLGSLVLTGAQIGSILCNTISGFLIFSTGNWKIVFYFWAILAFVWFIFYMVLCYSEPAQHPHITPEEKEELLRELGTAVRNKIPWFNLLCYKPTYALLAGQGSHDIVFFFVVVSLPKYFKDVLKFNIKENGILSSIPYASLWISSTVTACLADWLINAELLRVVTVRKLYTAIASFFPSIFLVLAGYFGCDRDMATLMFIFATLFMGPFYPGLRVNLLDITKNFAGILQAFVNGFGGVVYYPVPYIIAWVAKDNLIYQWMYIFWGSFVICSATNIIYLMWASADRAEWDEV